jgi:hypothetical protein
VVRRLAMTRLYQWLRTKPKRTVIGALVVLVALAVLWVAVRQGVIAATWNAVTTLPPQIWVPLVAAILTAFVSVGTVVYAKDREHKREIAQQQHDKKAALYREFMDYWLSIFGPASKQLSPAQKKKIKEKYYATFSQQLALWASEPALKEYVTYMRIDREDPVTMFEFEKIVFAFREDLGHSNEGLEPGDILHLFVKGVEEALRKRQE